MTSAKVFPADVRDIDYPSLCSAHDRESNKKEGELVSIQASSSMTGEHSD